MHLKSEIAQRTLSDFCRKPSVIRVHHHQAIEAGDNAQLSLLRGSYDLRTRFVNPQTVK